MENKNSYLDNLLVRINPLNIKHNYNDNVSLFKLIMNLCNDDEIKKLGIELADSFLLFNILKSNKKIKKFSDYYDLLYEKLSLTINKYSKLEKLLRNKSLKVPVFITGLNDNSFDFEKIYVQVSKREDNLTSINEIITKLNLIKNILCINNDLLFDDFKKSLNDFNSNFNSDKTSEFTRNIVERKNILLSETIISDNDLSDGQVELFNKINIEYKDLITFEGQVNYLEVLLDRFMSEHFFLEKDVEKLFNRLKEDCEISLSNNIKKRLAVGEQIKLDLETYENLTNYYYDITNKNIVVDNISLDEARMNYFKMYLADSIKKGEYKPFSFKKYLEKNVPDNILLLEKEKETEDRYLSLYSSYLIYKASLSNSSSAISFDEYLKLNCNNEDIDIVYRLTV